jgi:P-type Ca2+ transporter type 2C
VALSFGIIGSDIAKSQSAIELRDDNFESILAPISFGKNVIRSVKKYLAFLLTSHITLHTVSLISTAIIFQPPLNAMQLLWINVFLDIAAVVAIASGEPVDQLLETNPYSIKDNILTQEMWREVLSLAFY